MKVRPADFEDTAKRACQTKLEDAKSIYPHVEEGNLPYLCLDLVYQYTLLVVGFGKFCAGFGTVVHGNDAFRNIYGVISMHLFIFF